MNLSGFLMQGLVIPFAGYVLATSLFPKILPDYKGVLTLGWTGAFLLNFIGVDFLYYLEHRAFHHFPFLWKLHAPHHSSKALNIWVTSRNALVTHFLFVYILVNPILGYLCDTSEGFFAGAMVTAALDLFRHANIRISIPLFDQLFVMPQEHHRHHDAEKSFANYGANFIVWDKLFGTAETTTPNEKGSKEKESKEKASSKRVYGLPAPLPLSTQLFFPWRAQLK